MDRMDLMDREKAYRDRLDALLKNVGKMTKTDIRRVRVLLEGVRQEVAARIAGTEWEVYAINSLRQAVDRAVRDFEARWNPELNTALENHFKAGADIIDSPLQVAGIRLAAPELSYEALEIAQGYSADLIKGVSGDLRKSINGEIVRGITGEKTPFQVMTAIGRTIDKGRFKTVTLRAETITRTELARINSLARQARIDAIVNGTDVKFVKRWISSGKARPRPRHAMNNGMELPIKEKFPGVAGPIPYPHAPGISPDDAINCGCVHVLDVDNWDKLAREYEPQRI